MISSQGEEQKTLQAEEKEFVIEKFLLCYNFFLTPPFQDSSKVRRIHQVQSCMFKSADSSYNDY